MCNFLFTRDWTRLVRAVLSTREVAKNAGAPNPVTKLFAPQPPGVLTRDSVVRLATFIPTRVHGRDSESRFDPSWLQVMFHTCFLMFSAHVHVPARGILRGTCAKCEEQSVCLAALRGFVRHHGGVVFWG